MRTFCHFLVLSSRCVQRHQFLWRDQFLWVVGLFAFARGGFMFRGNLLLPWSHKIRRRVEGILVRLLLFVILQYFGVHYYLSCKKHIFPKYIQALSVNAPSAITPCSSKVDWGPACSKLKTKGNKLVQHLGLLQVVFCFSNGCYSQLNLPHN